MHDRLKNTIDLQMGKKYFPQATEDTCDSLYEIPSLVEEDVYGQLKKQCISNIPREHIQ